MRRSFRIAPSEFLPEPAAVLRAQGILPGRDPGDRTRAICADALALLAEIAAPRALFSEVAVDEFALVYHGEGNNSEPSPLAAIAHGAERLALFALTLGDAVSERIDRLIAERDFALGAMLDSAASEAAECVADALETRYRDETALAAELALLRYSPGYCGWHISGQRELFASLRPAEIGIELRESCLMEPMKSISGVLVGGPAEIHLFDDAYHFCVECSTHECRTRIRALGL